tara:strand:+ start:11007 stop:12026 length:1020 start_codon:yes stop_codon:yes gene_type:complete
MTTVKSNTKKYNKTKRNKTRRNKTIKHNKKNKFVVGVVAVPLTPDKKYYKVCGDSYIASSHISWLKRQGFNVLVIPYNTKHLKSYFDKIHALYLPSGGAFAGTQMTYYNCCKKLLHMAIKANDNGTYFPVWGCCMGFQQMLILADDKDDVDNFLQKFDSYKNLLLPIHFTKEGLNSKFARGVGETTMKKLRRNKCTMNNHKLGITPEKFERNKKVNSFYNIVGTSTDRKGREFVAIIEAKHYPFWGVQWHPERDNSMDSLIKFFAKEVKKSNRKTHDDKHYDKYPSMSTKKIDCMNYSENLYKKCNFYWHKKSSEHNKRLCAAAQLDKIENKDGSEGGI